MRSALVMAVPFAFIWAICGSALWGLILENYGTTWPTWTHSQEVGWFLTAAYLLFGAVAAVVLRMFVWLVAERRTRRLPVREARARKDIPVGQDWQEL
jgi:hypothetical protein